MGASVVAFSLIKRSLALAADLSSLLKQEANAKALAIGTHEYREAVHWLLEKKPIPSPQGNSETGENGRYL